MALAESAFHRVLHQVVRKVGIPDKRSGASAEVRDLTRDQPAYIVHRSPPTVTTGFAPREFRSVRGRSDRGRSDHERPELIRVIACLSTAPPYATKQLIE